MRKTVGRIADLSQVISASPPHGNLGISHTRWATHGGVTNENAHPHFDQSRRLVPRAQWRHRKLPLASGATRRKGPCLSQSQTDTEVLAHLIGATFERRHDKTAGRACRRPCGNRCDRSSAPMALRSSMRMFPACLSARGVEVRSCLALEGQSISLRATFAPSSRTPATRSISTITKSSHSGRMVSIFPRSRDPMRASRSARSNSWPRMWTRESSPHLHAQGDLRAAELRCEMPLRGRLSIEEATAKLGGLEMTNAELRQSRTNRLERLRHGLSRRNGWRVSHRIARPPSG